MPKSAPNALVRQRAVDACVKRFEGKSQAYGNVDCVRLAALALRKQGIAVPALRGVRYRSLAQAHKALEAAGFSNLIEAVSALGLVQLEIDPGVPAPLRAWPGDLIAMPVSNHDPFGASLFVVHTAGADRVLGFDGHGVVRVVRPDLSACLAAWRVSRG